MFAGFKLLTRLKGLRGGPLDPFGYLPERRIERALIDTYERTVEEVLPVLSHHNHATAVALARLPDDIRGYGHIKDANLAKAEARRIELLAQLSASTKPQPIEATG